MRNLIYPQDIILLCQPPHPGRIEMMQEVAAMIIEKLPHLHLKAMVMKRNKLTIISEKRESLGDFKFMEDIVDLLSGTTYGRITVDAVTENSVITDDGLAGKAIKTRAGFGTAWDVVKADPRA